MEWLVWLTVDVDLGGCASGQTWTAAKADLHGRCSRIVIPRPAHAQSPSHASRGKFCPSPAPLPPGRLPERHPCAGTLGVLWWGVHEDWGLPDSLQTRVGRGPLYPCNGTSLIPGPRVGLLELPRPRTRRPGALPGIRAQRPRPDAGRPQLPLSPSACQPIGSCVSIRTPLIRSAHIPGHVVLHRRRVCFPGDVHAPPIGTGLPPWP